MNDAVAASLDNVAEQIKNLGNAGASTPMGAIEAHGAVMEEGLEAVAESISDLAQAVRELAGAMGPQ